MSIERSSAARSRLVQQAIDEATENLAQRNEARARREAVHTGWTRNRWMRIGLFVAVPVLVAVLLWNVTGTPAAAARVIGPTATREEVEAAVRVVVDDIEAFDADYGELPMNLAEVGLPRRGDWRYTRLANRRYHLVVSLGGHVVTFNGR
jgi:hypothetical protein